MVRSVHQIAKMSHRQSARSACGAVCILHRKLVLVCGAKCLKPDDKPIESKRASLLMRLLSGMLPCFLGRLFFSRASDLSLGNMVYIVGQDAPPKPAFEPAHAMI